MRGGTLPSPTSHDRMAISGLGSRPLLIDNFKIAVRRPSDPAPVAATAAATATDDPTLTRLRSLVDRTADRTLEAAASGSGTSGSGTSGSGTSDLQESVDRTLAEIRLLIGQPPGSTGSALLRGVDNQQIRDVQVRSAPPGTAESFSGTVSRARAATAPIAGAGRVAQTGGRLIIDLGGRSETINVRPTSLGGLARQINDRGLGLRASVRRGQLHLTTNATGRGARLDVTASAKRSITVPGGTSVTGVNDLQLDSATAAGLAPGQRVTLSGSLDSVNSAAVLEYRGDGAGAVDGSATYDQRSNGRRGQRAI